MFANMKPMRACVGSALLAGAAAGLLAVTGCSSGSASSSASSTSGSTGTSAAASTSASAKPSSAAPSWATALGPAVAVIPPGTAVPGHGSPSAALAGLLMGAKDKSASEFCAYWEPSGQAQCKSQLSQLSASQFPTFKNAAPGYIAIDGDKAVAGVTGTTCAVGQTQCITNDDPAAIFTTMHTFSALWKSSLTTSSTEYSLTAFTRINGNWYLYSNS
jgi:hypothetical protein